MAVTIYLEGISVTVINIFNPMSNKKVIIIEKSIDLALNKTERERILLKNFNTHYPVWGNRATVIKTQLKYL